MNFLSDNYRLEHPNIQFGTFYYTILMEFGFLTLRWCLIWYSISQKKRRTAAHVKLALSTSLQLIVVAAAVIALALRKAHHERQRLLILVGNECSTNCKKLIKRADSPYHRCTLMVIESLLQGNTCQFNY